MGAADSSQTQSQRREMPLPGAEISAPPIEETAPPAAPATALPGEPPSNAPLSTASPCTATPHATSRARLLQTADTPPETARLVRCHNPWPAEDVLFCPDDALPAFVTGIPALSSGPELWIAVHKPGIFPGTVGTPPWVEAANPGIEPQATPPGIFPGTDGSPLRIDAAPISLV